LTFAIAPKPRRSETSEALKKNRLVFLRASEVSDLRGLSPYDNPVIFPSLSISIPSEAGIAGSLGIRVISHRQNLVGLKPQKPFKKTGWFF